MFDIGFLELLIVSVIALLVLGPERLPIAARKAGQWVSKARRMVSQFSREIDRQIEAEELRAELKKQGESLNIEEDVKNIQNTVRNALKDAEEFEPLPRKEAEPALNSTPKPRSTASEPSQAAPEPSIAESEASIASPKTSIAMPQSEPASK